MTDLLRRLQGFAREHRGEFALFLGIWAVAAFLRLWQPDLGIQTLHVDRDLYRALQMLRGEKFPLLGSEMQYGGRVLGPLVYFLYAIPLAISRSPLSVPIFVGLFNTVLFPFVYALARPRLGAFAALAASVLYAVFPLEIAQIRYYWNPSFLPGFVIVGLWAYLRFLLDGRRWQLVPAVACILAAFQTHLSAFEAFPSMVAGMVIARVLPGRRVVLGVVATAAVFFLPLFIYEWGHGGANSREVIKAPDARKEWKDRLRFNPNAWRNLGYHAGLQAWENPERLGFTYLLPMLQHGDRYFGGKRYAALVVTSKFGRAQQGLWIVGVLVAAGGLLRAARGGRGTAWGPGPVDPSRHHDLTLAVVLFWQFVPSLFLSFFNYHIPAGEGHQGESSIVPIRYFLISYPAPFLLAGIGASWLAGWLGAWGRRGVIALVAVIMVLNLHFSVAYLQLLERSGRGLIYFKNYVPTLRTSVAFTEFLVHEVGLSVDDFLERTEAQHIYNIFWGETTLDFQLTQHPAIYRNSSHPGTRYVIFDPIPGEEEPVLPKGSLVLREWKWDTIRVIQFTPPPDAPPVDNLWVRNVYYRDERMTLPASER